MRPLLRLVLLLAAIAFTLPARADNIESSYVLPPIGGNGGGAFSRPCAPNQFVTGFYAAFGKDMDLVGIFCHQLQSGVATGRPSDLMATGNATGAPNDGFAQCYPNAVEGMWVETSNVNLVHHAALRCRNLATGETYTAPFLNRGGGVLTHGGAAREKGYHTCAPGFAIGIHGTSGRNIDSLGLICGDLAAAPPAERPVKKTTRKGKVAAPVDNDNDAGDDGVPGRARVATTIYEQPNVNEIYFLEPGERVRIIRCGGGANQWCELSKPVRGFVWGPEIDR